MFPARLCGSTVRMATGVIDYRSAPPDPAAAGPTEFDFEMASERTRWIRRRFLWFCGVSVVIQAVFLTAFAGEIGRAPPLARALNVLDFVLCTGAVVAAFVYVWRVRMPLDGLLRL